MDWLSERAANHTTRGDLEVSRQHRQTQDVNSTNVYFLLERITHYAAPALRAQPSDVTGLSDVLQVRSSIISQPPVINVVHKVSRLKHDTLYNA